MNNVNMDVAYSNHLFSNDCVEKTFCFHRQNDTSKILWEMFGPHVSSYSRFTESKLSPKNPKYRYDHEIVIFE
jgi:hypothetical protein